MFNDNRKYKENCTIPTESSQNEVISFFVVFLFSVIQLGNKYELKVGLSDGRKSLLSPLNIRFTKIGLKFVFLFLREKQFAKVSLLQVTTSQLHFIEINKKKRKKNTKLNVTNKKQDEQQIYEHVEML